MCKLTYHYIPACGHVANWTILSCAKSTYWAPFLPEPFMICVDASIAYDNAHEVKGPCLWCSGDSMLSAPKQTSDSVYQPINGMNAAVAIHNSAVQKSSNTRPKLSLEIPSKWRILLLAHNNLTDVSPTRDGEELFDFTPGPEQHLMPVWEFLWVSIF